jgi:hypothetical protein
VFGREFSSGGHEFSILKAGKKPSANIFKLNETYMKLRTLTEAK